MKKTELDVILENIFVDDYYLTEMIDYKKIYNSMKGGLKDFISNFTEMDIIKKIQSKNTVDERLKLAQNILDNTPIIKNLKIKLDLQKIKSLEQSLKGKSEKEQEKIISNIVDTHLNEKKIVFEELGVFLEEDLEENKGYVKYVIGILIAAVLGVSLTAFLTLKTPKKSNNIKKPSSSHSQVIKDKNPDSGINQLKEKEKKERDQFDRVLGEKKQGQNADKYKEIDSKLKEFQDKNIKVIKSLIKKHGLQGESTSHIYKIFDESKMLDSADYNAFQDVVRDADDFSNYANSTHMTPKLTVKYLIWLALQ